MKIVAISDTHNLHRHFGQPFWGDLPAGDMILHCGDVTTHGKFDEFQVFLEWFEKLDYKYKVFVPGNHDRCLAEINRLEEPLRYPKSGVTMLNDHLIEIEGMRIYGSPCHRKFQNFPFGMDPMEANEHWKNAPACDILMTHGPPLGICDRESGRDPSRDDHLGLLAIRDYTEHLPPRYHFFGHVHHADTKIHCNGKTTYINCAIHQWLWKKNTTQIPVVVQY